MKPEPATHSSDPRRAAAAWHAAFDGDTPSDTECQAFANWLCQSPAHVAEYLHLAGIRERLRAEDITGDIQIDELLREPGNVASLPGATAGSTRDLPRLKRPAIWSLAASLFIGAATLLAWHYAQGPRSDPASAVYVTEVGEQRSVMLPDGSIADLNTRSTLEVRFSSGARTVHLSSGEAMFRVAGDAQRPFRVYSDTAVIQALGTEFNVRRDPAQTVVTVLEGSVAVAAQPAAASAAAPTPSDAVELTAGYRLAVARGKLPDPAAVEAANPQTVTAWKQRQLVFDATPLARVVAEFNRYNHRQIFVEDPALNARRVTGTFDAHDPAMLLSFLRAEAAVVVDDSTEDRLIVRPSDR